MSRVRRITRLRSLFHLLKLDPSARRTSTESLYLVGSNKNFALGVTPESDLVVETFEGLDEAIGVDSDRVRQEKRWVMS